MSYDLTFRAKTKDRPEFKTQCREPSLPKSHRCVQEGHEFIFQRFDGDYGCCKYCGMEVIS